MFKRRNLTPEENANSVVYNTHVGIFHAILREPSPCDEFYIETCKPSCDCMESVSFQDPIIMLFNQQRLENLGEMGATAFLDSLIQKESFLSEIRKNVSDEDLCAMMKSRYLQTPSEITAWCRYIEGNVDKFNSEVKAFLDAKQQQQLPIDQQNVEPQTS